MFVECDKIVDIMRLYTSNKIRDGQQISLVTTVRNSSVFKEGVPHGMIKITGFFIV